MSAETCWEREELWRAGGMGKWRDLSSSPNSAMINFTASLNFLDKDFLPIKWSSLSIMRLGDAPAHQGSQWMLPSESHWGFSS